MIHWAFLVGTGYHIFLTSLSSSEKYVHMHVIGVLHVNLLTKVSTC